jgi:hypothetical protein
VAPYAFIRNPLLFKVLYSGLSDTFASHFLRLCCGRFMHRGGLLPDEARKPCSAEANSACLAALKGSAALGSRIVGRKKSTGSTLTTRFKVS